MTFRPSTFAHLVYDACTLGLYELWYRRTRYIVADGRIEVHRGVFFRTEVTIPADRFTAAKVKLSPFAGSSRVIIDTGAGETVEARLLSRRDARAFAAACHSLKADVQRLVMTAA